jgi:hypothetical protein
MLRKRCAWQGSQETFGRRGGARRIPTTKAGTGVHPKASIGAAPVVATQRVCGPVEPWQVAMRSNEEFLGGNCSLASK